MHRFKTICSTKKWCSHLRSISKNYNFQNLIYMGQKTKRANGTSILWNSTQGEAGTCFVGRGVEPNSSRPRILSAFPLVWWNLQKRRRSIVTFCACRQNLNTLIIEYSHPWHYCGMVGSAPGIFVCECQPCGELWQSAHKQWECIVGTDRHIARDSIHCSRPLCHVRKEKAKVRIVISDAEICLHGV